MSKTKIETLNAKQEALLQVYVDRYLAYGLSTEQSTDEQMTQAVIKAYKYGGLQPPQVYICDSPIGCLNKYTELTGDKDISSIKNSFLYGNHNVGWLSFYAYFRDPELLGDELECMDGLIEMAQHCNWYLPFEKACIVSRKPVKMHLKDAGDIKILHSTREQALSYKDGFGIYCIGGVTMPDWVITNPEKLNVKSINKESNIEVRQKMIDLYGYQKYLLESKYKVLHTDKDQFGRERRLLELQWNDRGLEPIVAVEVKNSSPELDKTYQTFLIKVHPKLKPLITVFKDQVNDIIDVEKSRQATEKGKAQEMTCHNAVASTFGITGEEYGLEGQTRQGDVLITFKDGTNKRKFRES